MWLVEVACGIANGCCFRPRQTDDIAADVCNKDAFAFCTGSIAILPFMLVDDLRFGFEAPQLNSQQTW